MATVHRDATTRLDGSGLADLVRRRELLYTLVERQVRLRVKRSIIGVAWPVVAPLFLLALYGYVFGSVFKVRIEDYGVYLFAGLLPWTFLVQTIHDSLQSISFEPDLVRRAPFPHHLLPLARVIVMALPFGALLIAFLGYLAFINERGLDLGTLPMLLVPLTSLLLLVSALAMLLALIDVFNRDLRYVLNNLLTVWFFLVPIVYHERMLTGAMKTVTTIDPMRWIIDQFRDVLYDGVIDDPWVHVLTLAACAAAFVASLAVFRRLSVDLAKEV